MVVSVAAITLAVGLAPPDFESFMSFLFGSSGAVFQDGRRVFAFLGLRAKHHFSVMPYFFS